MLARLDEAEATLEQLRPLLPLSRGIGHNNRPPLDRDELEEIKADIAQLKAYPSPSPVEANKVASKFVRLGAHVLGWCGVQLDTFATEFMKSAGKAAGSTVALVPLCLTFGHQLSAAA